MTYRQRLDTLMNRPATRNAIMAVILFNAVILGLETSQTVMDSAGWLILLLDTICLAIFVAELAAKLWRRVSGSSGRAGTSSTSSSSRCRWCRRDRALPCCARCASCGFCA